MPDALTPHPTWRGRMAASRGRQNSAWNILPSLLKQPSMAAALR
jgi:hypothetical protein